MFVGTECLCAENSMVSISQKYTAERASVVLLHWMSFTCHDRSQILLLCLHIAVLYPAGFCYQSTVLGCYLWEVCGTVVLVQLAGSSKCADRFQPHLFVHWLHSLSWEPGLPVGLSLNGEAVLTQSVQSEGLQQFRISHSTGIRPHCILYLATNSIPNKSVFWLIISKLLQSEVFVWWLPEPEG